MLTAFSVKLLPKPTGIRGIANRLRRDKVEIRIVRARGVTLKHITYISSSGEVRLEKTDAAVGEQRDQLLCSDKLIFPHRSGYKRFCSQRFSVRLCTNMALSVLMRCQNSAALRVGIYDPTGENADFLLSALLYSSDVVAVTCCADAYRDVAAQALEELGASALITSRKDELARCHLIIAPDTVREPLPIYSDSIVLTTSCPETDLQGRVYYRYGFRMPNGFDSIKPDELDEEYFCSALYTLGSQYELGSIVPLSAKGRGEKCTVKSLADCLDNQIEKAYNN